MNKQLRLQQGNSLSLLQILYYLYRMLYQNLTVPAQPTQLTCHDKLQLQQFQLQYSQVYTLDLLLLLLHLLPYFA